MPSTRPYPVSREPIFVKKMVSEILSVKYTKIYDLWAYATGHMTRPGLVKEPESRREYRLRHLAITAEVDLEKKSVKLASLYSGKHNKKDRFKNDLLAYVDEIKKNEPNRYSEFSLLVLDEYKKIVVKVDRPEESVQTVDLELFKYKKTALNEIYKIAAGVIGPYCWEKGVDLATRTSVFNAKMGHVICLFDHFLLVHPKLDKASDYHTMILLVAFYISIKYVEDDTACTEEQFLDRFCPEIEISSAQFAKCAYAFLEAIEWNIHRSASEIEEKAKGFREHPIYDLLCTM